MKDNILCFSSYKLRKEKKETDRTTVVENTLEVPFAPVHEQVTLQILKLRKDLDALHVLVASL
jgi:hypothetical protein